MDKLRSIGIADDVFQFAYQIEWVFEFLQNIRKVFIVGKLVQTWFRCCEINQS